MIILLALGLELRADHVEGDRAALSGSGHVALTLPEGLVQAEAFRLEPGGLVLIDGSFAAGGQLLRFDEARLPLPEGSLVVAGARLDGDTVWMRAERLVQEGDGRWRGEGLSATRCTCAEPPWTLEAGAATLDADGVLHAEALRLRLCGGPALPLPRLRLQTAEHSGLLLPELGSAPGGLTLGLPVHIVLPGAPDLRLTPRWRQSHGLFGEVDLRGVGLTDGGLRAALGDDQGQARGALEGEGAWGRQDHRAGAALSLASDADWSADFGGDLLARRSPWREQRAFAQAGPLRLETDRFSEAGVVRQGIGAGVLEASGAVGGFALRGGARAEAFAQDVAPIGLSPKEGRLGAQVALSRGYAVGPLRLVGQGGGRAFAYDDGLQGHRLGLQGEGLLDLWGAGGSWKSAGAIGLFGAVAQLDRPETLRLRADHLGAAWRLGPRVEGSVFGPAGLLLDGSGQLVYGPRGLGGRLAGQLQQGPATLAVQASPRLQVGAIGLSDAVQAGWVGIGAASGVAQAWGGLSRQLPGALHPWRLGYGGRLQLDGLGLLEQGPRLAYASDCGCLFGEAQATWAVDRDLPTFGLALRLQP